MNLRQVIYRIIVPIFAGTLIAITTALLFWIIDNYIL